MNIRPYRHLPLAALLLGSAWAAQAQAPAPAADAPEAATTAAETASAVREVQRQQHAVWIAQARAQAATAQAAAAKAEADARVQLRNLQFDNVLEFERAELGSERLVKGAPYCADAIHETVQTLADGNRIVRGQSSRLCRDGEGRTRQEVERNGRHSVYLRDPIGNESWMLDVENKKARQIGGGALERLAVHQDSSVWREYGERMREWSQKVREQVRQGLGKDGAAPPAPPVPPVPPEPVVVTRTVKITRDAQGREQRNEEIDVKGAGALPAPPAAPIPPVPPLPTLDAPLPVTLRAISFAPRGPGVNSALGSKEIEGVKVNGERTTWTLEAGKVGNEKPIVITRDVWTSPELKLTVATRDFDPRSGEVNYRLQNLRRAEPEAALMKVPADYEQIKPRKAPPAPASVPKG